MNDSRDVRTKKKWKAFYFWNGGLVTIATVILVVVVIAEQIIPLIFLQNKNLFSIIILSAWGLWMLIFFASMHMFCGLLCPRCGNSFAEKEPENFLVSLMGARFRLVASIFCSSCKHCGLKLYADPDQT